MRCHEVDYQVYGDDLQFVEVELDPNETVIAEAGAMIYMDDGIMFEAKMGDGAKPNAGFFDKIVSAGKRYVTGESIFMTHFTNNGEGKKHVAFGAPYPGKIVPLNMQEINGNFICQKDSFLCAALGTELGIAFNKRLGAGFFGGEGAGGGDNEFIVRNQGTHTFNAGGTSETEPVTDADATTKLVGFVTGVANPDGSRSNYDTGLVTMSFPNLTTLQIDRGRSGTAIEVSYAVVEFVGAEWTVQRVQHTYGSTNQEDVAVPSVPESNSFIHAQKQNNADLPGLDEFGHQVWVSDNNQVSFN